MKTNMLLSLLLVSVIHAGCGEGDGRRSEPLQLGEDDQAQSAGRRGRPAGQCPDVCAAVCAGRPEPAVPPGCPISDWDCDCPNQPECPDVCAALCAGRPEPAVPPGCPISDCDCPNQPECPDVCAALCAGRPEPAVPPGCPIPDCGCVVPNPPACSHR